MPTKVSCEVPSGVHRWTADSKRDARDATLYFSMSKSAHLTPSLFGTRNISVQNHAFHTEENKS